MTWFSKNQDPWTANPRPGLRPYDAADDLPAAILVLQVLVGFVPAVMGICGLAMIGWKGHDAQGLLHWSGGVPWCLGLILLSIGSWVALVYQHHRRQHHTQMSSNMHAHLHRIAEDIGMGPVMEAWLAVPRSVAQGESMLDWTRPLVRPAFYRCSSRPSAPIVPEQEWRAWAESTGCLQRAVAHQEACILEEALAAAPVGAVRRARL